MPAMKIGRVGNDVALFDPSGWEDTATFDGEEIALKGFLYAATLAEAQALRTELLAQQGPDTIPFIYAGDDTMDGFYILSRVSIPLLQSSYRNKFFPYSINLRRIGSEGETEFQSLITGATRRNTHGLLSTEVVALHTPAQNHVSYNYDAAIGAQQFVRDTEDGNVNSYAFIGFDADPTWSVLPANFYGAACYVKTGNPLRLRAGRQKKNAVTAFEIGNKLMKITPSVDGGGVSDGRLDISWWTGAAYTSPISFEFYLDTNLIPEWHFDAITFNSPEVVRYRLIRDAEDPASIQRHTLGIELRRGNAYASFTYRYNDGAAHDMRIKEEGDSTAMTAITPTGAATAVAHQKGNLNWLVGSSFELSALAGGAQIDPDLTMAEAPIDFFIGYELSDTGIDTAQSMCLQYHAPLSVYERAVRR